MREAPLDVGTDDIHATPRRSGHHLLDIALTAIFISGVSLFVAIEHGHAQQQLVAANSWPFLSMTYNVPDDSGLAYLSLTNEGVGPAKIEYLQFLYEGSPVTSFSDLMHRCCDTGKKGHTSFVLKMHLVAGAVMRPGDDARVMEISSPIEDAELKQKLQSALYHLKYSACYCSIFDECWISNLQDLHPQKVKACPANAYPFSSDDVLKKLSAQNPAQ